MRCKNLFTSSVKNIGHSLKKRRRKGEAEDQPVQRESGFIRKNSLLLRGRRNLQKWHASGRKTPQRSSPLEKTGGIPEMRTKEMERYRGEEGFTLVEMMVVIIIVGILAAVAVPLYTGYVEKSKITEATSIIGAIITSEKLEMQRVPSQGFYSAASKEDFKAKGLDLSDTKYFTYSVEASGGPPNTKFEVTATATTEYRSNPANCWIKYTYDPSKTPVGKWSSDGTCITADMIPGTQ
jgi:type IV pilus assembly protein PilE